MLQFRSSLITNTTALLKAGGWPDSLLAPSPIRFTEKAPIPREMTAADIQSLKDSWAAAVKRAIEVGFDVSLST